MKNLFTYINLDCQSENDPENLTDEEFYNLAIQKRIEGYIFLSVQGNFPNISENTQNLETHQHIIPIEKLIENSIKIKLKRSLNNQQPLPESYANLESSKVPMSLGEYKAQTEEKINKMLKINSGSWVSIKIKKPNGHLVDCKLKTDKLIRDLFQWIECNLGYSEIRLFTLIPNKVELRDQELELTSAFQGNACLVEFESLI